MAKCFVYKYFVGFSNRQCLVMANDEAKARELFFKSHPTLRPSNLLSVAETKRTVYQLDASR